jgi:hypothetical protein
VPELTLSDHETYCPEAPPFEEELPMTLTLGLMGCDGWLLAADRRVTETQQHWPPDDLKPIGHCSSSECKIVARPDLGVWYASSGYDNTREAGEKLLERIQQGGFDRQNPCRSLRLIANEYALHQYRSFGLDRLTIILDRPPASEGKQLWKGPQLWAVDLAINQAYNRPGRRAGASQRTDQIIGGDWGNAATLLPQLYYSQCSVERLITLAAFTIQFAVKCSPTSISRNFDILVGRAGQAPQFVPETRLNELRNEFDQFDAKIAAALGLTLAEVQKYRPA